MKINIVAITETKKNRKMYDIYLSWNRPTIKNKKSGYLQYMGNTYLNLHVY